MNEHSQQQQRKKENRNELCVHRSRQCSSKAHYGVILKRTKKIRHKKLFQTHDSSPLSFLSSRMRREKKNRRHFHVYYFVMFVLEKGTKTEWNMIQTEKKQRE